MCIRDSGNSPVVGEKCGDRGDSGRVVHERAPENKSTVSIRNQQPPCGGTSSESCIRVIRSIRGRQPHPSRRMLPSPPGSSSTSASMSPAPKLVGCSVLLANVHRTKLAKPFQATAELNLSKSTKRLSACRNCIYFCRNAHAETTSITCRGQEMGTLQPKRGNKVRDPA